MHATAAKPPHSNDLRTRGGGSSAAIRSNDDAVAPTGHAEVVADLAAPLPAIMISDLMGYDRAVWPQVKWWSEATMASWAVLTIAASAMVSRTTSCPATSTELW